MSQSEEVDGRGRLEVWRPPNHYSLFDEALRRRACASMVEALFGTRNICSMRSHGDLGVTRQIWLCSEKS
jgi:hypothetical protein